MREVLEKAADAVERLGRGWGSKGCLEALSIFAPATAATVAASYAPSPITAALIAGAYALVAIAHGVGRTFAKLWAAAALLASPAILLAFTPGGRAHSFTSFSPGVTSAGAYAALLVFMRVWAAAAPMIAAAAYLGAGGVASALECVPGASWLSSALRVFSATLPQILRHLSRLILAREARSFIRGASMRARASAVGDMLVASMRYSRNVALAFRARDFGDRVMRGGRPSLPWVLAGAASVTAYVVGAAGWLLS